MHRLRMATGVALVLLLSTFVAHAATVDITSPADNSTVDAVAVLVQGTGSDPGIAKVVMRVNNGGWYVIAGTTNWSGWATLQPGANLVEVRAYDNAGLWGPIDDLHLNGRALRPVVQFCSPVDGSTVDPGPVLVKGTALDDVSVVKVVMRVNGGVWQLATGTDSWWAWASIVPGANLIEARASDDAGLWGPIASMTLYGGDPVPPPVRPIVQFCSPINGATLIAGPVMIKGRALDDVTLDKVILRVNGGAWHVVSGTTVWMRWATIGLGANLIEARAYNSAGLWGPIASMTLHGVPDTPPTTVITTPADGATIDRAAVLVTGTAADDGGVDRVILRVNGGSWYLMAGTTNWSGWATIIGGHNLIEARAYDNAGQWGPIVSVEIEGPSNPAPVTLFNSPADGTTIYASRVLVTGTAIDDGSVDKVVVRVNSGVWYLAAGTNNWSREVAINIGPNLIEARAVDNLGRWGPIAAMTLNGGQMPISLGSAGEFAVLAGSTVSNSGPTVVNGDLGVSPGSAVTGFPPGVVNGTMHAADPAAAQAKLDLTNAYLNAAGRATGVVSIPTGELGGLTLTPGLYQSGISSFAITSVDLTLDAQGDPNAVFIFQMPSSTLTVGNGRQVILSGSANPANIYWQVGSSATLGTTSAFKGNIMAQASITMQTGATLDGRALTQTAGVTLDSNTINRP